MWSLGKYPFPFVLPSVHGRLYAAVVTSKHKIRSRPSRTPTSSLPGKEETPPAPCSIPSSTSRLATRFRSMRSARSCNSVVGAFAVRTMSCSTKSVSRLYEGDFLSYLIFQAMENLKRAKETPPKSKERMLCLREAMRCAFSCS